MSDIIMESEDALKQERLFAFWKENGSFILAMVLLTIVLTGAMSAYRSWDLRTREAQTAQVLQMVDAPDFPANIQAAVESGDLKLRKDLKALSVLRAAGEFLQNGNTAESSSLLSTLSKDKSVSATYRDLAVILWAQVNTEESNGEAIEAALLKITENEKSTLRPLAIYQYGVLMGGKGKYKEAQEYLGQIDTLKEAPETLRERARAISHVYSLKMSREEK